MSQALLSLLIFDKSDYHSEEIKTELRNKNIEADIILAQSTSELLKALTDQKFDCVILIHQDSSISVTGLKESLPKINANVPLFLIVEQYDRESAREHIEHGAFNVFSQNEIAFGIEEMHKYVDVFKKSSLISEQRKIIRKEQERFHTLVNNIPSAVAYIHQGGFINVNPKFAELFQFKDTNKLGETSILDMIASEDQATVKTLLTDLEKHMPVESPLLEDIHIIDNEQQQHIVDIICHNSNLSGEDCIQIIFIEHREELVIEDTEEAEFVPSEQLSYTPEYLIQRLNHNIRSGSTDQYTALCLVEAADYGRIKKNLGITRAERIMQQVHELMLSFSKEDLLISQTSTDIYCLLITKESREACIHAVEQIQDAFTKNKFIMEDVSLTMPLNIGLVHLTPNINTPDQAFSLADVACTVARNKKDYLIHVYNPDHDRSTVEVLDQDWNTRIVDAFENNNFKLVFQPVINLKTPGAANYEVLLRMKSSGESDILPNQFLHAAKQNNLDINIDKWVIENTLSLLSSTQQFETTMFLKLSENSVCSLEFINWFEKILSENKKNVVLEISEETAIQWPSDVLNILQGRKHGKYKVCIEHFGNHPDAMDELLELNADFYKIDGAFVNHLATNRKHQSIINKIAKKTKKLNIETIACFVQDADSLAILWQEGINFIQGNYLQKPESNLNYQFKSKI